jgi:signal transduction histidine kinase
MNRMNLDQVLIQISGKSEKRFEQRLLLGTILVIGVGLVISTLFNLLIGLKPSIVIVSLLGAFLFLSLYIFGRLTRSGELFISLTSLSILIYTDLFWFVNYGSYGPILPLFIVFYAFLILVFSSRNYFLISLILFLNLSGLFIIEHSFPDEIGSYTNRVERLMDNYLGMGFCLLVIYLFTSVIKNNYIREFQRAKKSDQLKSAFLANISHEVRTPLNAIIGLSTLLSDPEIPTEDKETFTKEIHGNSDYLIYLIEDIVDVSKIESNQLSLNISNINVTQLIHKVAESFQKSLKPGSKIKIVSRLTLPEIYVKVDQFRFEQILRNLLSNAIKFTNEGCIEIDCLMGNSCYVFSVRDTGIGIEEAYQNLIFDRFIKVHLERTSPYRGIGIGLYLCKKLVEMHGGQIWVNSVAGMGSNFCFTIPCNFKEQVKLAPTLNLSE